MEPNENQEVAATEDGAQSAAGAGAQIHDISDASKAKDAQGATSEMNPQAEIARLTQEKSELHDRMLRLAADYENFRRRARREMDEAGIRGMENLLKETLPVLDNLDRALDAATRSNTTDPSATALIEGVRLVQRQFFGALEKFQVKTFDAQGKPFDPAFHEAVQQVESETLPAGTVATVFQRGYTAGARLLRPALVAVVSGKPSSSPKVDDEDGDEISIDQLN